MLRGQPVNQGLPGLYLSQHRKPIGAIAIAPSNPDIVYVGTTDFSPHFSSVTSGKGIYKTTNAGLEWTSLGGPSSGWSIFKSYRPISSMVVDPTDPNTVYVGTVGGGIWKTTNGGESWEQIWDLSVHRETLLDVNALAISAANPNVIYAAAYNFEPLNPWSAILIPNRLIKSEDSGSTWETLYETSPLAKVDDIAVSSEDANIVYFITDYLDVYKSVDGGDNWQDARGTNGASPLPSVMPLGATTGRICSISIHPDSSNVIYVAKQFEDKGIYLSSDSGAEWSFYDLDAHVRDLVLASGVNSPVLYAVGTDFLFKTSTQITYELTVSSAGGGSVTTPSEGTFTYNASQVVNLVATPDANYQFVNWTGGVATIADANAVSTTITMNGSYSITANFTIIAGVPVTLSVTLQGRPSPPNDQWIIPVNVWLHTPGAPWTEVKSHGSLHHFNTQTSNEGIIELMVVPGTYDIRVKGLTTLKNLLSGVEISLLGSVEVNIGTLIEGDVNGDNAVTGLDYSAVIMCFGYAVDETGAPAPTSMCDFNNDGYVTGLDYSAVIMNFGLGGADIE